MTFMTWEMQRQTLLSIDRMYGQLLHLSSIFQSTCFAHVIVVAYKRGFQCHGRMSLEVSLKVDYIPHRYISRISPMLTFDNNLSRQQTGKLLVDSYSLTLHNERYTRWYNNNNTEIMFTQSLTIFSSFESER